MSAQDKYERFLEDEDLQRWVWNLSRESPDAAEVLHRRLGKICELLSLTPQEILNVSRSDIKRFQDSLEDLVTELEAEKKSRS